MKYYRLLPDMRLRDRMLFGDAAHIDNWRLLKPQPEDMEPMHLKVKCRNSGRLYDFGKAGYAGLPIVTKKFVDALAEIPEVSEQYFHTVFHSVEVEGVEKSLFLMIVEDYLDALDEEQSQFTIDDGSSHDREDLVGTYESIFKLKINPKKAEGRNIFYLDKAVGYLIVSQRVVDALEAAKITGASYIEA